MKAKFLATLSILVFVLASLAGCGSTSNEVESTEIASEATTTSEASHEHNYTETITVEATCETDGEATYTCDCGDTYTEAIDKITEHSFNAVVTPPTCTEDGLTNGESCQECGEVFVHGKEMVRQSILAKLSDGRLINDWQWSAA